MLHSFISYGLPVQVPDLSAPISSAVSTGSSAATVASSAGLGSLLKKYLLRAAGEEGLAENVHGAYSPEQMAHLKASHHGPKDPVIKYHTEYQTIPCIDTNGQTLAIWLNVLYLAPLTVLFVRFFVKSYTRRAGQGKRRKTKHGVAGKVGKDALKGVQRELHETNGVNGLANGKH